ncbi:MAG: thermonuclease family protein [Chloroflexota bacterium]
MKSCSFVLLTLALLTSTAYAQDRTPAHVVSVTDGDTVVVSLSDRDEKVRLIGIDAPESVDPNRPKMCWADEASARAKELLGDRDVELELDKGERDRFGRLLAYVWIDGENSSLTLAREGHAVQLTIAPNTRYVDQIAAAVAEARDAGRGLWGACPQATPAVAPKPSSGPTSSSGQCPPEAPIKGNRDSHIYHSPGQRDYERTKAEECFVTGADAEAAGYRAAQR